MTGLDALAELRQVDREIPFVLMTAFGDEDLLGEAARTGASFVLCKPFELDALCEVVERMGGQAEPR